MLLHDAIELLLGCGVSDHISGVSDHTSGATESMHALINPAQELALWSLLSMLVFITHVCFGVSTHERPDLLV